MLAENYVTTLEHYPYSTDLPPAHFLPVTRLISALKGWRICDATDIIENATEELKRFSQELLPEKFPAPLQSLVEVHSCTRGLF